MNLLFLLLPLHEASQLLALAWALQTVATLVPDIWGTLALTARHPMNTCSLLTPALQPEIKAI